MKKQHILLVRAMALTNFERETIKVERNVGRAKKLGLEATLTIWEWLQIKRNWNFNCAFCQGKAETMEHIVPLSRGGGTHRLNVVPACEKCNTLHGKVLHGLDQRRKTLEGMDWDECTN